MSSTTSGVVLQSDSAYDSDVLAATLVGDQGPSLSDPGRIGGEACVDEEMELRFGERLRRGLPAFILGRK